MISSIKILLQEKLMGSKPMRKELRPLFLFAILILTLTACGNAASTAAATPTPSTPATLPATPTNQSTPASGVGNSKPAMPLKSIRMVDAQNGWALTAQSILKTSDGGVHWKDVTPTNAALNSFARGNFFNEQYAWIAIPPPQQTEGPGIFILRTTDGGDSWQSSKINDATVALIDVPHFLSTHEGWLEASSTPGAGHAGSNIWHTTDGGQTWTKIASNAGNNGLTLGYVTGISFRDTQNGIATGNGGAGADNSHPVVSITHDGGRTWQTQSLPHLLGGYTGIINMSQPPVFLGNTVFLPVSVATSSGDRFVLYRSNTGGQTWFQTSVVHIRSENAYVLDSAHSWATDAQSGLLYSTSDGGNNWSPTSNVAYNLQALSFIDTSIGWGLTANTLLHTTEGGRTWQQIQYVIQ